MARDSSGSKNQPQYAGAGAPADAADLSEVANYAADNGNRKALSTTARNALAGADVWEGLRVRDLTDKQEYERVGSAWVAAQPNYREFTLARTSVTDGAAFFMVLTEVTAHATPGAFQFTYTSSGGNNGYLQPEAGRYLFSVAIHPGAATTGTAYSQVREISGPAGPVCRGGANYPADPWMQASGLWWTDGSLSVITEVFKTTGGSTTATGILRIEKLASI